jgi:CheY-like chemotaxis protein
MAGRILVLDDEENYAEMLQDLLRENNYRVDMATRPERALSQLEEIPYDLVISDYKMPVMDGADFLKKARELYSDLPFILVSGLMNTPELVKVANMNVTLVMEKPLDTEAFLQHVARFSSPMTDLEKEQFAGDRQAEVTGEPVEAYPAEPQFFSAINSLARHFLRSAWEIAQEGGELIIHEPEGSDVELAIKDISNWRGNGDMPVTLGNLPSSNDEALSALRALIADPDHSRVIALRLTVLDELERARELAEHLRNEVDDAQSLLFVYVVTGGALHEFISVAGKSGVCLPPICQRPSDLAVYARRMARIATEQTGRSRCAEFLPDAVYALLSYDWPRNYKQIQELIHAAVRASEDEPISLDALSRGMGIFLPPVAPERRLTNLMHAQQRRYFKRQLDEQGLTAAELAKKLEFDPSIQTKDDLNEMHLFRRELGSI